jgi:dTDP-4-amino-4,6-dideoxygalactose transaminase
MNVQPKQIINKICYANLFINKFNNCKRNLIQCINTDYNLKYDPIFLGRARMGIYLLIKYAISNTKRKKVLLSAYTIPDVINLVILAGGEPYFIDSKYKSTNLDLNIIQDNINDAACVLITHYHILQNDIYDIKQICINNNVYLYEDCAIAFGGKYDNVYAGNIGDAAIFSLSGYKQVNFFWGGFIITSNSNIHNYVLSEIINYKELSIFDYFGQAYKILRYDLLTKNIIFNNLTFNYIKYKINRSNDIYQLKIPRLETECIDNSLTSIPNSTAYNEWLHKYKNISNLNNHRQKIARIYDKYFFNHLLSNESDSNIIAGSCFINYPIIVNNRDKKYKEIINSNIDVGLSIYPNCANYAKFSKIPGEIKNFDCIENNVIYLPTHNNISCEYAEHISSKLVNIL